MDRGCRMAASTQHQTFPFHHPFWESWCAMATAEANTFSATDMNEWQRVGSQKQPANDRLWVKRLTRLVRNMTSEDITF